jgi:hypothetical protein
MKNINLSNNIVAIVDDEDFETVNKFSWCLSSHGYAIRRIYVEKIKGKWKTKQFYLHREIIKDIPKGKVIDHINNNRLDNRKANLRVCSIRENISRAGISKANTSGFKGVKYKTGPRIKRWQANIKVNGKAIYSKHFLTKEEAAKEYDKLAKLHLKEFAYQNYLNNLENMTCCDTKLWTNVQKPSNN